MNIQENLKQAVTRLKQANVEDSIRLARLLLAFILQVDKEYLITHDLQEIGDRKRAAIFLLYYANHTRKTFAIYYKSTRVYEVKLLCR